MLSVFIVSGLVWLDVLLLKFMPGMYASVGIILFKKKIQLKPEKTLADVGVYIGIQDDLIYKEVGDKLVFRSKFTYETLRSLVKASSIIKGDIKISEGDALITQRLNMTAIIVCGFFIAILLNYKIDLLGYVFSGVIFLVIIVLNFGQKAKMVEVCDSIERNINQEKEKTNWPD